MIRVLVLAMNCAALFMAGCAVPLGPGFRHGTREASVREVVSPAAREDSRIHIRVTDELENSGNRDLTHVEFRQPTGLPAGVAVAVRVNDSEAAVVTAPNSRERTRIQFAQPWQPRQTQAISFEYDLRPFSGEGGGLAATRDDFYVCDSSPFPAWLPPSGLFVKADARARSTTIEITAPADFRVLASGQEIARTQNGSVTTHWFRTTPEDFPPYMIAGRYQERVVATRRAQVTFWTLQPLDARTAEAAANRLAGTAATFSETFGPANGLRAGGRARGLQQIRVAETSAPIAASDEIPIDEAANFSATSFPHGVLFDSGAIARGIDTEPLLRLAEYTLAQTWFSWRLRLLPQAQVLFGRGMPLFAIVLAAEAREGSSVRRREIARLLDAYDRARARRSISGSADSKIRVSQPAPVSQQATDIASTKNGFADSSEAAYKSALFLAALEDLTGKQNFAAAVRRMLQAMVGQEVSYGELRSGLEFGTHHDLAQVFRTWRRNAEIPRDFRARYASP